MNEIAEWDSIQDLRITDMYNLLVQKFTLHGVRSYFSFYILNIHHTYIFQGEVIGIYCHMY
jgi:hypothetical protein